MLKQLNKVIKISFLILILGFSKAYSIDDDLGAFTDAIDVVREEFNNISEASTEQSKIIDEAMKQIDKATEYVQEAINQNNAEDAIKTLEFIEKSLSDVESIIPQEFGSDMSQMDTSVIPKEDMDVVNEVTAQMKTAKEEKLKDFMSDLVDLNQKGIDTVTISENLNSLGIETIKLDLNIGDKKKMETWTKEEWANSYKGSILTSSGEEVITDKEINSKVVDLEQKLQANTSAILDKRSSLTELQTKIDPLSGQITDLKTQKIDLLAKYNEEILKQSSNILSDEEINKSKDLANEFNSQLSNLTSQIKTAEEQSNSLQQQLQGLNLELTNEIASKSQLEQNISSLSNQLTSNQNLLTKKELELDQLKSSAPNLNKNINQLNSQLEDVSLQKDFVQVQFERSIDKEVEAFNHYAEILWDGPSSTSKKQEVDFAIREVSTMMDNDPKKQRILEIEKYGIYAGLSDAEINKGINAIQNDDWEAQKEVTKSIYKGLNKSSEWNVSIPSNAEINVIITEEKAIQEASYASIAGLSVRDEVHDIINDKTKDLQSKVDNDMYKLLERYEGEHFLKNPSCNTCYYSNFNISEEQRDLFEKKTDEFINSNQELKNTLNESVNNIENFNNKLSSLEITNTEITGNMLREYNFVNKALKSSQEHVDNWENWAGGEIREKELLDQVGVKNPDDWNEVYSKLRERRTELYYSGNSTKNIDTYVAYKDSKIRALPDFKNKVNQFNERNPQVLAQELKNKITLEENKISNLKLSSVDKVHGFIKKEMDDAKSEIDRITNEEIAKVPEYNFSEKVVNILNKVPTFEGNADFVADLDPAMMRAKLYDIVDGTTEVQALEALRTAMAEIGDKPVSEFMTGPYWEMSNVKAAAILKSKKYSWIDDYAIYNHYNPLNLSQSDLELAENQLSSVLKTANPKLDALNEKITKLTTELEETKSQSLTINEDINNLENEFASLKTSETEIQNQISDLSNQFNSKESLITEKQQSLVSLQDQLNPLSDKMTELEGERAELDTKLNNQLNTIATQIESQGQATEEANTLKAQFESQIAALDSQLQNYEKETVEINTQLTSLTSELTTLETDTPQISSQIENLNKDLENFVNIKADLAMAVAEKYDLEVQEKVINAVKPLENKSIISIEGSNLFRVVDTDELIDDKGKFKLPTGTLTLKGEVYTAGAVQPEKLFTFASINNDQEINNKILELEKKFESGNLTEEELRDQRDSLNATRNNMKIEYSEAAAAQFASSGKLVGGEQDYNNTTLGSWVLVNATTGEQMTNPLTGHSGSMVCEGSVCGLDGDLGKQASAFGGMYVLESLADEKGNVSGICGKGGCKFDVDTLRVLGPDGIANNVFNDSGEGLFQQAFTSTEIKEIEKYGMTTLQRKNAIEYALKNNIEIDAAKLVDQDSLDAQTKALAYAAKNNTFVSEINKQAGAYTKFKTDTFRQIEVTDVGKEIQEAAKQASEATTEVAAAAKEATESVKETVAEVTKTASKTFLTGNDLEELSKLANDAHGSWVLVDAATGKQMADPLTGHVGAHAGKASMMSATGDFGKAAAEFGGVYVLENLASESGNVASSCGSGDCQFDIGN